MHPRDIQCKVSECLACPSACCMSVTALQTLDLSTLAAYVLEALGHFHGTAICGLVRTGKQIINGDMSDGWSSTLKTYLSDFKFATGNLPVHADDKDPEVGNRR